MDGVYKVLTTALVALVFVAAFGGVLEAQQKPSDPPAEQKENNPTGTVPTTALGALIFVVITFSGIVVWVIRYQWRTINEILNAQQAAIKFQQERIDVRHESNLATLNRFSDAVTVAITNVRKDFSTEQRESRKDFIAALDRTEQRWERATAAIVNKLEVLSKEVAVINGAGCDRFRGTCEMHESMTPLEVKTLIADREAAEGKKQG